MRRSGRNGRQYKDNMPKAKVTPKHEAADYIVEVLPVDALRPHPENYKGHPDEQIEQIAQSLKSLGQYKPIVISQDGYILAGHGVTLGAKRAGSQTVIVHRKEFPADDPRALKIIVADNALQRLSVDDSDKLTDLLAQLQQTAGLDGTSFDDGDLDRMIGEMAAEDFEDSLPDEFCEVDPTDDEFTHRCPRCNFEWNDPDD